MLAVDGQSIYFECSGNPAGQPALFLHGGPGSGASPGARRFFDPTKYRIVVFDQRGCGRSRPLCGAEPEHLARDLAAQTTEQLIADIEALRVHLGVKNWVVLGVSWGTTLGLAYAVAHPVRVIGVVLALVTTSSRREVAWITEGVGRIFPREWERFAAAVPEHLRQLPLVDAYAEMLCDADPTVHQVAAREWCMWEDAHVSLSPGNGPSAAYEDPAFRLRFARLVTHYWRNAAFLPDDVTSQAGARLTGIPGVLIHGIFDVSGPLETAWQLSKVWRTSRLVVLDDTGHGGMGSFPAAVIDALDEVATAADRR